MARASLAVFALMLVGCGYVGDPLPPALNIPQPVTDLAVQQRGDKLLIQFTIPPLTTDRLPLRVGAIELRGGDQTLPAEAAEPGPVSLSVPLAPFKGRKVRFQVRVASHKMKWSDVSNPVELEVTAPVPAPDTLRAEATAEGVRLSWSSKAGLVRVERRGLGGFQQVAEVKQPEWLDKETVFGESYQYRVMALAGRAESDYAGPVEITPRDTFPPSAPLNVTAVEGIGSIELTWDRSRESDVAGYRVYRGVTSDVLAPFDEIRQVSSFSDREVKSGTVYFYAVSAVDQAGNESKPSEAVEIKAP
ncbi:MAG: hypothetical protein FJW20_17405 [Acidimicrobiia bacterium]|nr:hypothetical protein [Acidimicrobiia bacterium]